MFDSYGSCAGSMLCAVPMPATFEADLQTYLSSVLAAPVVNGFNPQRLSGQAGSYSFALLTGEPGYTLGRAGGFMKVNYQISTWSVSSQDYAVMEQALQNALSGFRGYMGSHVVTTSRLIQRGPLSPEAPVDDSDSWTYHLPSEYYFIYRDPIPYFP